MTTRSTLKTEHNGAKNGGGYWGRRAEAKAESRHRRRVIARTEAGAGVEAWAAEACDPAQAQADEPKKPEAG